MDYKQKRLIIIIILLFGLFSLNFSYNPFYINNSYRLTDYNLNLSTDTGFQSPSEAINIEYDEFSGIFNTLSNVLSQTDTYAFSTNFAMLITDYLRVYDFGFVIPDGAIIDGFEVQIDDYSELNYYEDYNVFLVLNGATIGDDKGYNSVVGNIDSDIYRSYGGASDMWGTFLSESDVESSTFGVQICYSNTDTELFKARTIWVDHIQIKIFYSEGSEDSDPPTWDTLIESADPLELGTTEIINVNVYDESIISYVYLEFDSSNYSMSYISGNNWRYSIWTPVSVGEKIYQIHMIDEYGNINQTDDLTITVQDTTNPIINNIIESADPLILGNNETITCDITDYSDMEFVYLEFQGNNYSMNFISGITWNYDTWKPSVIGNYSYIIWAKDIEGNIHYISGNITVVIEEDKTEAILIIGIMVGSLFIIGFLMLLMLYFYLKTNRFLPILITFLFSIIFGITSFNVAYFPFTPYIQIFFVLFQTIIFYLVCIKTNFTKILKKDDKK